MRSPSNVRQQLVRFCAPEAMGLSPIFGWLVDVIILLSKKDKDFKKKKRSSNQPLSTMAKLKDTLKRKEGKWRSHFGFHIRFFKKVKRLSRPKYSVFVAILDAQKSLLAFLQTLKQFFEDPYLEERTFRERMLVRKIIYKNTSHSSQLTIVQNLLSVTIVPSKHLCLYNTRANQQFMPYINVHLINFPRSTRFEAPFIKLLHHDYLETR